MISLTCSLEEYNKLDNDDKRKVFESLAHRILLVHPEYYTQLQNIETIDLCLQIWEETKNFPLITKKEEKKIKKLLRRIQR